MIWILTGLLYIVAYGGVIASTFAYAPNSIWPVIAMLGVSVIVAVLVRVIHRRPHNVFLFSAVLYFAIGVSLALAVDVPVFVEAFLAFGIVFLAFSVFTRVPA